MPGIIQSNIFLFLCPPGPPLRSRAFSMQASSSHRKLANRNLVAGLPHISHFSSISAVHTSKGRNDDSVYVCFLLAPIFSDRRRLPNLESASAE